MTNMIAATVAVIIAVDFVRSLSVTFVNCSSLFYIFVNKCHLLLPKSPLLNVLVTTDLFKKW